MRIGVDIVAVERVENAIARYSERFLDRIFTPEERSVCGDDVRRLAGRFAAKEAVSKALGTGLWRCGITFRDIEILRGSDGEPLVMLHGAALARFRRMHGEACHISISHEHHMACAFSVIETTRSEDGEDGRHADEADSDAAVSNAQNLRECRA